MSTLTLWRWSPKQDSWVFELQSTEEHKALSLRGARRRNPRGTRFRWTETAEPPARKYRARAAKTKD